MILCDTNIFIEAFKDNPSATEMLRRIGFQNISLSAVTLMELYFGACNKRELAKIKSRMKNLETLILDGSITNTAIDLIAKYSKSHGLQIPDALIAATAICHDMELLTYNVKDFKFIKGIKMFTPL
ncbi:MAG: type II toxin-antitoxin system VapC family toxin [Desulfobacteraceae bacterium]|jgi:predicted nucleic acid-binding protein|nr:MAG: type II toxin-antitoxin system VapC family toxin [Desulfobacteraceae bacterium]